MLLTGYRQGMVLSQCRSSKGCLRCLAHLNEDVSEVIPYLNAVLGGYQYLREPLALTLKIDGKLVTVYATRIAINNLVDAAEAERLLEQLKDTINDTWAKRGELEPCYQARRKPSVVKILKALGDTDCRDCGEPSCVVYAVGLAEGSIDPDACAHLPDESRRRLRDTLVGSS